MESFFIHPHPSLPPKWWKGLILPRLSGELEGGELELSAGYLSRHFS